MRFYCIFLIQIRMLENVFLFICQVNEGLILKVQKSVQVIEETIINLSKEMKELTDLWAVWNFKINQVKPIKQQCWILEEQLNKVNKIQRKQLWLISRLFLDC